MPRQARARASVAPRAATGSMAAAAENSWARRRGSPDDALFALLRSAGTAATARGAPAPKDVCGTRGSAIMLRALRQELWEGAVLSGRETCETEAYLPAETYTDPSLRLNTRTSM